MLDGLGTVQQYVARAKELGQSHLAITDHGNLCGLPEFYRECRDNDIEPILGCEFYYVEDAEKVKEDKDANRYHVVVLARGEAGYKTLCELSTESHRSYYYKPLLDRRMIEALDYPDELTVLSGCAGSVISQAILEKNMDKAEEEIMWWREAFPHFYVELQNHDTPFDRKLNKGLIRLAKKYDLPWVVTNDPHYVVAEDCDYHDTLLAVQTNADIDDEDRFRFDGGGYHLRSASEMRRAFAEYGKEIFKPGARNTVRIARDSRTRIPDWERRTWHIPRYPDAPDAYKELVRLTKKGLKRIGKHKDEEYVAQAKHELKIFKETNLADFMLITMDCIEHARKVGIPVGPGRGSVCGTLVGYVIGIHKIDPMRYKLKFERFLNPARPKMPDIDTDFGQRRREEMFTYVEDKYGIENTVHVAAYQRMKMKRTFQSVARAYGINFTTRNEISKLLTDDDEVEDVLPPELVDQHPDMASQLVRLSGLKSSVSAHPAGVIIADPKDRIRELVPEMWIASSKRFVGQYALEAVEAMGLLKQDFLGLRTLDTIDDCVKMIKQLRGEDIDPDSWIPDEESHDREIYKMLARGETAGVFQMEGPVNQRGCKEVQPRNFEDLVSITSLYRTGPIQAGYPAMFNANRQMGDPEEITYYHPMLKPILMETWGVILYQEQVMEIAEVLAGFDMARVDDIKEAIKHKKSALMVSLEPEFVEGCEKNGISEKVAKRIWKDIEGYSGYSYNRSHAVAYTFITYQTARLKHLYPIEYITALVRTAPGNKAGKEKRTTYLKEALRRGIDVLPPDINISDGLASPDGEREAIRFGLTDIAGVGDKAMAKIEEARPEGGYTSVDEVAEAVRNKGTMAALRSASAFLSLGEPRSSKEIEQETEELLSWTFRDRMKKYRKKYKKEVRIPSGNSNQRCRIMGEIFKVTRGSTKTGRPYLTWKIRWSLTEQFDVRLWQETKPLWKLPEGSIVMVTGDWEARWMNVSVNDPAQVQLIKRGISG